MPAQHPGDQRRRGALGGQHTRRSHRQRESQRVAEAISEKQLCRRVHDVVFADAEHRNGIAFSGLDQTELQMDRSFGPTGRAGGIKPEAGLVGMGRGGLGSGRRRGEQIGERALSRLGARDDHFRSGPGQQRHRRLHCRQYRCRHHHRACPAVAEHKGEFVGAELGVDRDRHDSGLDRPEKGGREVDAIMQAQEDALLVVEAEPARSIGEPVHSAGKLGIGVLPAIIDDRGLRSAPSRKVALDQISRGVVSRSALHRRRSPLSRFPMANRKGRRRCCDLAHGSARRPITGDWLAFFDEGEHRLKRMHNPPDPGEVIEELCLSRALLCSGWTGRAPSTQLSLAIRVGATTSPAEAQTIGGSDGGSAARTRSVGQPDGDGRVRVRRIYRP